MSYTEDQLTPWFDIATENPVRPGCYLVGDASGTLPYPFHWFDGTHWFGALESPELYAEAPNSGAELPEDFYIRNARWRGLNFDPTKQKGAK